MKRIIAVVVAAVAALLAVVIPAAASHNPSTHRPSTHRPSAVAFHPNPSAPAYTYYGPYTIGDLASSHMFFNDPSYVCGSHTGVVGYPWVSGATNENVWLIYLGGYSYMLEFAYCGSVGCIYDDVYGNITGKAHNLYQDYCNSGISNDDWILSSTSTYYWFTNGAEDRDALAWNTQGANMYAGGWDGGNTEWNLYAKN